jgi:hypothetical protein
MTIPAVIDRNLSRREIVSQEIAPDEEDEEFQ